MSTPRNDRNVMMVQMDAPAGQRIDVVSPNWCDKTTWYAGSGQALNEVLVDSGDGLTFNSANTHWIDVTHGKLTGEDNLAVGYSPSIWADGSPMIEDLPFGGTQHDYTVDYVAGTVTFHEAPTKPVTASYHYADSSSWSLAPTAGKLLRVVSVELQFSADIEVTDSVHYSLHVDGQPYGSPTVYKTMADFVNESAGAFPAIPALGGAARGTSQPMYIFQWPYDRRGTLDLKSSLGMEIHIQLANDTPFGGEHAAATFYCISEDE